MKKIILMFLFFVPLLLLCSCQNEWLSYSDVKNATRTKYEINKWYTSGTKLKEINFEIVNGDNVQGTIDSFPGAPSGNPYLQEVYENHKCFLAIGKNLDGEFKYLFYNDLVKYGVDVEDTIGCSDYTMEYTFDDVYEKCNQLVNEYYGDYIINLLDEGRIELSLEDLENGNLAFYNKNYDQPPGYEGWEGNFKISTFKNDDNEMELTVSKYDNDTEEYIEVYSSSNDERVTYTEITLANFLDYFSYDLSYSIEEKYSSVEEKEYFNFNFQIEFQNINSIKGCHIDLFFYLEYTYVDENGEHNVSHPYSCNISTSNPIFNYSNDYWDISEMECSNQTLDLDDISGFAYISFGES